MEDDVEAVTVRPLSEGIREERRGICAGRARLKKTNSWVVEAMVVVEVEVMAVD